MHPEQIKIFRSMTPEQKLRVAFRLYDLAWKLKAAGLRLQHPDWSDERIAERVREIFLYPRS
jgi:hypothetical protein